VVVVVVGWGWAHHGLAGGLGMQMVAALDALVRYSYAYDLSRFPRLHY